MKSSYERRARFRAPETLLFTALFSTMHVIPSVATICFVKGNILAPVGRIAVLRGN